jgi:hypothetical protein
MKSQEKLVLGIAGYARTGKDMVGSTLVKMCKKNSVRIVKLAASLREIVKADPKTPKWMNVYSEEPKMKSEVRPLLVKTAQEKSEGKGKKAEVAKPAVQAVKNEETETIEIEVLDADEINGVEEITIDERTLTEPEMKKKEEIVKSMKKGMAGFKERYGSRASDVMYATATARAKGE